MIVDNLVSLSEASIILRVLILVSMVLAPS